MSSNSVARQFAMTLLFILMLGSGISLAILLTGNRTLALQVCGGAGVICVLVLIAGGVFVGRGRS